MQRVSPKNLEVGLWEKGEIIESGFRGLDGGVDSGARFRSIQENLSPSFQSESQHGCSDAHGQRG